MATNRIRIRIRWLENSRMLIFFKFMVQFFVFAGIGGRKHVASSLSMWLCASVCLSVCLLVRESYF